MIVSNIYTYRAFLFNTLNVQAIIINPIPVNIGGSKNVSANTAPIEIIAIANKINKNCAVAMTEFRFIINSFYTILQFSSKTYLFKPTRFLKPCRN